MRTYLRIAFTLAILAASFGCIPRVGSAEGPKCPNNSTVLKKPQPPWSAIRGPPPLIDFDKYGLGIISGYIDLQDGAWVGLDTSVDFWYTDCSSRYPNISITFSMSLDYLKLYGDYETCALITSHGVPILGSGHLSISSDRPWVVMVLQARHDENDSFLGEDFSFDMGFESLSLYAEDLKICGVKVDWEPVNEVVAHWNLFWSMMKPLVDKQLTDIAKEILEGCTLTELIKHDLKADCLNFGGVFSGILRAHQPLLMQMVRATCEGTTTSTEASTTTSSTTPKVSTMKPNAVAAMKCGQGMWVRDGVLATAALSVYYISSSLV